MRRFDTVIFDLDGTLLDTLEDLADSTNYALRENGFPTRSLAEVRQFVGNGVARLIHLALPARVSPELEAKCLETFKGHYRLHMRDKTGPYPGVPALLERLQADGFRMAVVSNKLDDAVKTLCREYFGPLIPVALGERPGIRKKPAPDLVRACMVALGGAADRCVYVGDSDVDIQSAQNAGLPCLSVSWGFRDRDFLLAHGAGTILDTPEELERALL